MRNDDIYNSWSKVKPDAAANERMLANILGRPARGRRRLFRGMKIAVPVAACVVALLAVFVYRFGFQLPPEDYPPLVSPLPVQEDLTMEQARGCPNFGVFIPVDIPDGFEADRVWRMTQQDAETLFVFWTSGLGSVTWQVANATEHDLAVVVDVNDRAMFDLSLYAVPWFETVPHELLPYVMNPVFLAREVTLDAVQARAVEGRGGGVQMNFSVLFGNVVVTINANGLQAQDVWGMVQSVLN